MNRLNQMVDSNAIAAMDSMIMMKMSVTPKNGIKYMKVFEKFVHDLKMWEGIRNAIRRPSR